MLRKKGSLLPCGALLAVALPLSAQSRETRSEVELPLSTYDSLRAAAREKTVEPPAAPWASTRLLRGSLGIDVAARRATWEAELAAVASGEEPPAVPLVLGAAPIGRSSVSPEGATLRSDGGGTQLRPQRAGAWKVVLAGEVAGQGDDERAGLRFVLPRLASAPSAFDLTLPADASAAVEGGVVTLAPAKGAVRSGRVTVDPGLVATLVVSRAARSLSGPAVVDTSVHTIVRLSEESVRSEVRLGFAPRRGALSERRIVLPRGALVSVDGPVIVEGPAADGGALLKFEPPLPAGESTTLGLTLVAPRRAGEVTFTPDLPRLDAAATERIDTELTVVSGGGTLLTPPADSDWSPRAGLGNVRISSDESALGFVSRERRPRPLSFGLRQLKALTVASALSRVSLTVFVGESGETRTRLLADVRSRGRASLRFRVPENASFLAARTDGHPAAVSRPAPGLLELPIDSSSGRTRVELLLGGKGPAPRPGETLTLASAAPDEPIERVSWAVVLPPGLSTKEESKALAPLGEPPVPRPAARAGTPPGEKAAVLEATRIASDDRLSRRDGFWSPEATLPSTPVAFRMDLSDVEGAVPPLSLTVVEKKEKSPWY